MAIDLYVNFGSPPCRTVIMVAKHLGIEVNKKVFDSMNNEHLNPEFIAINPQHTVPTIVDDGFALWESRAIAQYLAGKVKSDLYPSDLKKRATVDRLLQFDMGTLSKTGMEYFAPLIRTGSVGDEEKHKAFKQSLDYLNGFLEGNKYVAGNHVTIADLSIVATISTIQFALDYDFSHWKNINQWLKTIEKELPYYEEINVVPLKNFKDNVLPKLKEKFAANK